LKVTDAMNKEIICVDKNKSVKHAAAIIKANGAGCCIVLSKGQPIGMLTERDISYKLVAEGLNSIKVKVGDIMSSPLVYVDPDSDLIDAARVMCENKIRRLAVVRHGILYGVLSALDIARHLEDYVEGEVRKILRHAFFMT
jgi:CBS domain-containing protein